MTCDFIPKISVIIPFYKVEKFFSKCLDSIVNQTLRELEIVLIDDCGNDSSINIAKEFAAKDNRIRIITNPENKGQGYSRNIGIKESTGDYIAFVDADDWLEKDAYEKLYKEAENSQCEITNCDFVFVHKGYTIKSDLSKIFDNKKTIYNAKNKPVDYLGKQMVSVWNGLYKRDFLKNNNLYFDETTKLEDKLFCWQTRLKAKNILFIPNVLYNYNKINELQDTQNYDVVYNAYFKNIMQIKQLIKDDISLHAAFVYYAQKHLYWLLFFTHDCNSRVKIKRFFKKEICKNISPHIFNNLKLYVDKHDLRKTERAYFYENMFYSVKDMCYAIKTLIKLRRI